MRVPYSVLNGVVFLGYRVTPGDPRTEKFGGSGFIASVELGRVLFSYIVTAEHVASALEDLEDPIARMNDGQGNGHHYQLRKPSTVEIAGRTIEAPAWYRHPTDSAADVAVTDFMPTWTSNSAWGAQDRLAYVPTWMFVGDKMLHPNRGELGIGDEVFIAGLFAHLAGRESNSPLLRIGNIAMLPRERINVGPPYGFMEAYLIEAKSTGGISGAPIFVRGTHKVSADNESCPRQPETVTSAADYWLLGLVHGHLDIPPGDINSPNPALKRGNVNMGLAVVTPAKKILETLNHPALIEQRRDFVQEITNKKDGRVTLGSSFTRETFTRSSPPVAE
jgi:hypothetical protein